MLYIRTIDAGGSCHQTGSYLAGSKQDDSFLAPLERISAYQKNSTTLTESKVALSLEHSAVAPESVHADLETGIRELG